MTALAAWAEALVGIANIVLKDGFGSVGPTHLRDGLFFRFDEVTDSERPLTATYLHAGCVCVQYIAHHQARTDELVSA